MEDRGRRRLVGATSGGAGRREPTERDEVQSASCDGNTDSADADVRPGRAKSTLSRGPGPRLAQLGVRSSDESVESAGGGGLGARAALASPWSSIRRESAGGN